MHSEVQNQEAVIVRRKGKTTLKRQGAESQPKTQGKKTKTTGLMCAVKVSGENAKWIINTQKQTGHGRASVILAAIESARTGKAFTLSEYRPRYLLEAEKKWKDKQAKIGKL